MASLNDIKRRIKSVKNTQQITKAMKMVAAAKLRKAQEDITNARPYAEKMFSMVKGLASGGAKEVSPFLTKEGVSGKIDLVVFTSDKGLCGGFNTNIIKRAERFIREEANGKAVRLHLIGIRGNEHFKRRDYEIVTFEEIGSGRPHYDTARGFATSIMESYLNDETDEVHILYGKFVSALTQEPTLQKLMPFESDEEESKSDEVSGQTYEPGEKEVLEGLMPKAVEVMMFNSMLETAASEHAARMASMDAASRNAKDMIGSLQLIYNRVRQAAITTELMEIIGGAEALKK